MQARPRPLKSRRQFSRSEDPIQYLSYHLTGLTSSRPPSHNPPRPFFYIGLSIHTVTGHYLRAPTPSIPSSHSLFTLSIKSTMSGTLVGFAMLVAASVIFTYYSIWTLLMPFVDEGHPLQSFFPARVWAIRIPVILILLGSAVVGSFLGTVMIRSNRKKAAKAKAAAKKKA